mmetsp:Transcript_18459/g.58106  ORF Transcript_18459/g.58106 Transcript_18459/m.58106 type:complete len:275 (-) Transcript_18459:1425-2249(-)
MRRETECDSVYSDMSMRTRPAFSSSKSSWATARAVSVLPVPVGPMKRKVPSGASGRARPARERMIALATASMAASWPTTRVLSLSARSRRRTRSDWVRRLAGMPVHRETTSETWSGVTDSLTSGAASSMSIACALSRSSSAALSARSLCSVSTMAPYSRSAARSRSPWRRAMFALTLSRSSFSWSALSSSLRARSAAHCSWSGASCSRRLAILSLTSLSLDLEPSSFSRFSEMASISSEATFRSSRSRASGLESSWTRRLELASSTRSIALSGR